MKSDIDPIFLMLVHAYPELSGAKKTGSNNLFKSLFNDGRSFRRDIAKELAALCALHKDGSYATQSNRASILHAAARTLQKAGFQNLGATSLKPKHVEVLLAQWRADKLAVSTIKNRMSALRWWAGKVGKQNCVPKNNSLAGISARPKPTLGVKAIFLEQDALEKIKFVRVRISLELQQAFGLRREESIKFQPNYALSHGGDYILLKGSWCPGGKPRQVPITSDYQRDVLTRAKKIADGGSMIPPEKTYVAWLSTYKQSVRVLGLKDLRGLRHGYAHSRFEALTGFMCPLAGGPLFDELSDLQRQADYEARTQICKEIGNKHLVSADLYFGSAKASVDVPLVCSVSKAPAAMVDMPEACELVTGFMHWIQRGLAQHEMRSNEAGAMVHFVEQGMALVSPLIFKKYAKATAVNTAEAAELAMRVQRELIKCGWHLPGPNKTNIVKYEIHAKGRVVGTLSCVVLVQPSRFVLPVPPSNPALKMA